MNIFDQASQYTIDDGMKKILQLCAKGRCPPEFKIQKGRIVTAKGNTYDIPGEPIEVFNLVFNIINGIEIVARNLPVSTSRRILGINDDAVYSFAKRKMIEYGRDNMYMEKLVSCIYTALYSDSISQEDFEWNGDSITSVRGIDYKELKIGK